MRSATGAEHIDAALDDKRCDSPAGQNVRVQTDEVADNVVARKSGLGIADALAANGGGDKRTSDKKGPGHLAGRVPCHFGKAFFSTFI